MTVRNEIDRALAMAHASKGSYMMFATESEDAKAEQVFAQMAEDMDRHVQILESRRQYLNQYNQLNGGGDPKNGGSDQKNGSGNQKNGGGDQKKQES
jgi:hypothetical protein